MKNHIKKIGVTMLASCILFSTSAYSAKSENTQKTPPALKGKLLYHNYSGYENWDAELFILDFSDNSVTNISSTWNVDHEMNAMFSSDGKRIVFMADEKGGERNWDIFLWTIGDKEPVNLTAGSAAREEDPKFSPDGTEIVFKSNNDIKIMTLSGELIRNVTNTPDIEESMPYYTTDGSKIIYAPGVGADSDIYTINADGTENKSEASINNYQEYYPITRDSESYFYTGWVSRRNKNDQVFLKYFSNPKPVYLLFNDKHSNYSDATPVGSKYVALSSTRKGGKGGYDNYIADLYTGDIWSLDEYNSAANSRKEDLGAHYLPTLAE
jgi:Tol biopolymer transport system component